MDRVWAVFQLRRERARLVTRERIAALGRSPKQAPLSLWSTFIKRAQVNLEERPTIKTIVPTSPDRRDRTRIEGLVDKYVGCKDWPTVKEVDEVLVFPAVVFARLAGE